MSLTNSIVTILVTILSIVLVLYAGAYFHEVRHQQIFEHYGISSSISLEWYGMATKPNNTSVDNDTYNQLMSFQEENDNFKYNLFTIEIFLALIFFFEALKYMEE